MRCTRCKAKIQSGERALVVSGEYFCPACRKRRATEVTQEMQTLTRRIEKDAERIDELSHITEKVAK